jgi:hypothetical protein
MPDVPRTKKFRVTYSNGEELDYDVLEIPGAPEGTRVINGGVEHAAWVIFSGVALNVAGAVATHYLKYGLRNLRLRLAWGTDEDKRLYFSNIAYLEAAARFPAGTPIKVIGCDREGDKWVASVAAGGFVCRVEVAAKGPAAPEVLCYIDKPVGES